MKVYTNESRRNGRWQRVILAAVLVLSTLLSVPALAAPAQQSDRTPLNLGQMARGTLATGESALFSFEAPEDTTYVFTTGDPEEAQKFDLIITDESGAQLYNDIFETVQLDLDDGDYTAELVAVEAGDYSIFITGQIGDLSGNSNRPGDLQNGSFVTIDETSGDLYAILEIADTDFWQQVFVALSGGDGDDFYASISSSDFSTYESVSSTLDEGPLRFFSRGDEYDLTITPAQDGPLTVVVLTSGPAPSIEMGESIDDFVSAPSGEMFYVVQPSEAGREVTVTLTSDSEDVDLDLAVATTPGDTSNVSSAFGSNESVTYLAASEDPIYIRVYAYDASRIVEDVPFTLLVEEGEEAAIIEPGVAVQSTAPASGKAYHLLTLPDGGVFVTVMLSGGSQDIDLQAGIVDDAGANVTTLYSSNSGSAEIVSYYARTPTTWQIMVNNSYSSQEAPYTLLVSVVDPDDLAAGVSATPASTAESTVEATATEEAPTEEAPTTEAATGEVIVQLAIDALASSEYGPESWSAMQVVGEPDAEPGLDDANAWAAASIDAGIETLELTFETPVIPTAIDIYENYNPGAVIEVAALDPNSNQWVVLWEGEDLTGLEFRIFSPELTVPSFATNEIRITLDTSLVDGWNEIDAVELFGVVPE